MSTIADTQCAFESGRAFGKTATAFRAATGQRMRMNKAPKTYTIHRGTVRSSFALYHHTMAIYRRHTWANAALGKATANLIAADRDCSRMADLIPQGKAHSRELDMAKRNAALASQVVRAAQSELKNATARAEETSKMHIVTFVPPYVPVKASRVYPALKTCTSPRRAAKYVNDILRAQDDDAREDAWFVQRYAG